MGFTRHWHRKLHLPDDGWKLMLDDMLLVWSAADVPIAYDFNVPAQVPIVGRDGSYPDMGSIVRFNGIGEDGHETVLVQQHWEMGFLEKARTTTQLGPDWRWDFCKTNRKPYDTVLCCLLACMKRRMPNDVALSITDPKEFFEGAWTGCQPAREVLEKIGWTARDFRVLQEDCLE